MFLYMLFYAFVPFVSRFVFFVSWAPHAWAGMMPERRSSQTWFICVAMRKLDLSHSESNLQTQI